MRRAAWRIAKTLARCLLARALGVRIIWTVHNLRSHEGRHPHLERLLWRIFCPQVDAVVSMTKAAVPEIRSTFRLTRARFFIIPHGEYRPTLARLDVAAPVYDVGMLGAIRPYKRHELLLEAVAASDDASLRILIAGPASDSEYVSSLRAKYADARVTWAVGHVPDLAFQRQVLACRLLVMPQDALNSGSLMYALSCGRPVLAVDTPTFREIADFVGKDWLQVFVPPLTMHTIDAALERLAELPAAGPDLSAFDWRSVGVLAARAYDEVVHG